jgi:hypothetical protein
MTTTQKPNETKQTRTLGCPACSHKSAVEVQGRIYRCAKCEGIYGSCYLGDSYAYVLPFMAQQPVPAEQLRYFDFSFVGSKGPGRRHGWYDPATKLIHQIG